MRKSERIYDMMVYLNGKKYFNLKDLIHKYNISKSTALRDIQSLEEIGIPIYSEKGRHGKYVILDNKLLSPIVFTIDEMYALYFSMLTLDDYQTTPFQLNFTTLKQKFQKCLSEKYMDALSKMETILRLHVSKQPNISPFLKNILEAAMYEDVCRVTYKKQDIETCYIVQFYDMRSKYGQWYTTALNYETGNRQVFRCDKIMALEVTHAYQPQPLHALQSYSHTIYKQRGATAFSVNITLKGVDLFYKENYPSMKLFCENGQYRIEGFYNKDEEDFIAKYFTMYGDTITHIEPTALKNLIVNRMALLVNHFKTL